ncbi:MAG: hypothetical protein QNJ18_01480 [Xenococcaceae cyanobacterium MO_167.B52]|nr:hypothetical protein [Xenococcaceae cyanobacterium MO_167.B52]
MKAKEPFFLGLTAIFLSIPTIASAQSIVTDTTNNCSLISDSELLKDQPRKDTVGSNENSNTVSSNKRTTIASINVPTLWWAVEQFDPFGGKLVNNWLARPSLKQIDVTVNWQFWTLLDYLGRYRFLNQFGTVAREYGYDLRVFNQEKQCLGIYEYNLTSNPPKWQIKLEDSGQGSLQVQPVID